MKSIPIDLAMISLCIVLVFAALSCDSTPIKYTELHNIITGTPFINVHAHPALGHRPYSDRDLYPTLEPLMGRPYWPIPEDRIAAENSRQALYMALSRLIDQNRIDEDKAMHIAKQIMRDNAIRVHNLE
jgi:hypothetical protein